MESSHNFPTSPWFFIYFPDFSDLSYSCLTFPQTFSFIPWIFSDLFWSSLTFLCLPKPFLSCPGPLLTFSWPFKAFHDFSKHFLSFPSFSWTFLISYMPSLTYPKMFKTNSDLFWPLPDLPWILSDQPRLLLTSFYHSRTFSDTF